MKNLAALLLLLALSYWSIRPLFSSGFFPMHDDTQPTRVQQMAKALADGQFPVRWVSDLGYGFGYPIFNFYAPLPYYAGAIGMLGGMDALVATKLVMGLGMILAGLSMYVLVARITGPAGGLVGSILYLYAPYHAVNLYVRGAVGELWAYGFLPLVVFGIYETMTGNKKRGVMVGSVSIATVLLSHNILGMITLMFFSGGIIMFILLSLFFRHSGKRPQERVQNLKEDSFRSWTSQDDVKIRACISLVSILFFGIGLSSFFTVPAFVEKGYAKVEGLTQGGSDFHQHFVSLDQLWDSPWGYAGSAAGRADGMSFKIGKLHLILATISSLIVVLLYKPKKFPKELWVLGGKLWVIFLISVFLMLSVSQFVWETIPGFAYIQYPWRFLTVTVFVVSLLGSFSIVFVEGVGKWVVAASIIVLTIFINGKYFIPQYQDTRAGTDYTNQSRIRFAISKISDEYMPIGFPLPDSPENVSSDRLVGDDRLLSATTLTNTSIKKEYTVVLSDDAVVIAPVAYFPGWNVVIDGVSSEVFQKNGQIYVLVPKGMHTIFLSFYQTPVEWIGNAISLLSLFLLGYVSLSGSVLQTWGRNHPSRS